MGPRVHYNAFRVLGTGVVLCLVRRTCRRLGIASGEGKRDSIAERIGRNGHDATHAEL